MNVSDKGIALIKEFEGCVLKAYPDPGSLDGNPWTIGYGHTKGVKKGDIITKKEALEFLKEEANDFAASIIASLPGVTLNQHELDALTCLVYNIGITAFKKSTIRKRLLANDRVAAANAFGMWVKNDGKTMAGLVRRRAAEKQLFMEPVPKPPEVVFEAPLAPVKPVAAPVATQDSDKPLTRSKEIASGVGIGAGGLVTAIQTINVTDLISMKDGLANTKKEVAANKEIVFHTQIIQGASILMFLIGLFIIYKRIKDRMDGKR